MNAKNLIEILEACAANVGVRLEDLAVRMESPQGWKHDVTGYYLDAIDFLEDAVVFTTGDN